MAIGTAAGTIIGAAIGAGTQLFGASKQSSSANRAAELQAKAQQDALAFAREQAELERARYEEEQARLDAAWEAEQARREPIRNAGMQVLSRWGFDVPETGASMTRPEGWIPGLPYGQPGGGSLTDYSGMALGRTAPPDVTPALRPRGLTAFMGSR